MIIEPTTAPNQDPPEPPAKRWDDYSSILAVTALIFSLAALSASLVATTLLSEQLEQTFNPPGFPARYDGRDLAGWSPASPEFPIHPLELRSNKNSSEVARVQ